MLQTLLTLVLFALSALAWSYIFARWREGLPIVAYRRRRPDPWGLLDVMLFLSVVAIACGVAKTLIAPETATDGGVTPRAMIAFAIGELIGSAIGIAMVMARHGIPLRRLRWNRRRIRPDVFIGVGTFFAMAIPMYLLQAALRSVFESESHPLIQMVKETGVQGILAASLAAVIAAPITEELLFRMLLQGWLESIGMRSTSTTGLQVSLNVPDESASVIAPVTPLRPLWPTVVSAALFAVAHGGHGTDPIPLFPMALALGYLYRQTHRIAPCIIMHASLNACSMLILWSELGGE